MNIDMVLIHGWAMNSAVWQPCLQRLPGWINSQCIDLPGYGESVDIDAATLDGYVDHVAQKIPRPALLVGWSLGGLVSLELARRYPEKVTGLFQVATSPKFVQDGDWQTAIEAGVFEQFAASLQKDRLKTIRRFLALQVQGSEASMQTLRELQRAMDERGQPGMETLSAGLRILSGTDLVGTTRDLDCPVSWLLADKDALVPVELADSLEQMPSIDEIRVIAGAGHAPFISHPEVFAESLQQVAKRL